MGSSRYDFDLTSKDATPNCFVRSEDGTLLGVSVFGDGPLTILLCNGFWTTTFYWHHTIRYFSERFRVISWDYKGHGNSGVPVDYTKLTAEDCAKDALRILDALGVDKAVGIGFSFGSQVLLEVFRAAPKRLNSFITALGPYGYPMDSFFHPAIGPFVRQIALRLHKIPVRTPFQLLKLFAKTPIFWTLFLNSGSVNKARFKPSDFRDFFDHFGNGDPYTFSRMASQIATHDASDLLSQVNIPTLIISGGRDTFTLPYVGRAFHREISDSEYMLIPGATHTGLVEYPRLINQRMETFLDERVLSET